MRFLAVTWFWYGLSVFALAAPLGIERCLRLAIATGGYGLAWSAGVLALGLVPVGIGVREAILTAVLLPVLPVGAATAVAAASRVVQTLGDATWAGIAGLPSRPVRRAESAGTARRSRRVPRPRVDLHNPVGLGPIAGIVASRSAEPRGHDGEVS